MSGIILEEEEITNSSQMSNESHGIKHQYALATPVADEAGEQIGDSLDLMAFDVPCSNSAGKTMNYRVYYSEKSVNFWFQLAFLEFKGLRALAITDEQLLLGEVLCPTKMSDQTGASHKVDRSLNRSLMSFPTESVDPLREFSFPPDSISLNVGQPFQLDRFLPNDEGFRTEDYTELEDYLQRKQGPHKFALGVVEKSKYKYQNAFREWARGAQIEKCVASLSMYLRDPTQRTPNKMAIVVDTIIDVAIQNGLYYTTQIDRLDNHPSLIYNIGIMMDCDPVLRDAVLKTVSPLVKEELSEDKRELFNLEKAVWAKPSFMKALVLYLIAEFHRMDKKYFLGLTFLEYCVMVETESSEYGLILGDLLEYQNQQQDITQKLIMYYFKAYKCSNPHISSTALARLSIIYERNFAQTMADQPISTPQHLQLYTDLMATHGHLAKIYRPESMMFKMNHYLKCLCYVTGEKQHVTISQREIENLTMSRKLSLEKSMEYFQFFYIMGERGELLVHYFDVMNYLEYKESSLIAIRISLLNAVNESFGKRNYYLALCAKMGVGVESDSSYAFKLLDNYYLELSSKLNQANNFEMAMCLTHIADIMESKEKDSNPSKLRSYALRFVICSDECKKMTNRFIYELSYMLRKAAYLYPSKDNKLGTEEFVISLWENGFYLPCTTTQDYIYHYLIEQSIADNLFQFDTLKNVWERLENTSMDRSRYLRELNKISAVNVDPAEKHFIEKLADVVREVKNIVTFGGTQNVSIEFLQNEVSKELQECGETFQILEKNEEKKSSARRVSITRLNDPNIKKLRRAARVLTSALNYQTKSKLENHQIEEELDHHAIADFGELAQAMQAKVLMESALEMMKKYQNIRLFHHSEIVLDEDDPISKFYNNAYIYNCHFKSNLQKCKVFRLEIFDLKRLDEFMEKIVWIATASPFFLNYYGIRFLAGKSALTVDIVSEDFDTLLTTQDCKDEELPLKPWTNPDIPISDRYQMIEDLMLAVQSLHFIGKPHLTLTASHMVIYGGCRLKVIVPFFMDYFNDFGKFMKGVGKYQSSVACTTVYLSPRLVNKPLSPRHDFEVLYEDMSKAAKAFLKSDIWSIGVFLLEMLAEKSFARKYQDYQADISRKWKVDLIVTNMIKEVKKKLPNIRLPTSEIEMLMHNNHTDRPEISNAIIIISDFMKKEFGIQSKISTKLEKNSFLSSYFDTLGFTSKDGSNRRILDSPLNTNKPVTLHLRNNLEFYGRIDSRHTPQGRCVIKHNRNIVLDAEFVDGVPASTVVLVNKKAEQVELTFDGRQCTGFKFSTPLSDRGKIDLTGTLEKNIISPSTIDIIAKFDLFSDRKCFAQLIKEMNSDIKKTLSNSEKRENLLDSLAQKLIGSHRDTIRRNVRRRTVTKAMIDELKYLGLSSDSSDSEDELNPKRFQTPGKKDEFKDDKKLSEMEYMDVLDQVDRLSSLRCKLSEQIDNNPTWRQTEEETMKHHKTFVEYVDPFGYRYQLEYKTYYEKVHYNGGFNRMSYRLESLTEVLTFKPQFSYFKFLVTDLFQFRFMEASRPLTTFSAMYFQTLFSNNYGYSISIDQIGNMYKGRFQKGVLVAGEILGAEDRCMRVKSKVGDRYHGILLMTKEEMSYQGETDHLSLCGYGSLHTSSGKKVFIGNFENDLPHGYGILYDKYGKLSKDGFSGYFCSGIKLYGKIEDDNMELEGNFSRVIPWPNNPHNKLGVSMNLKEILQFNQKSFSIIGWMLSKSSQTIKFGNFKDSESFLTGLYRVNYPDGNVYKGYFADSLREGEFIMVTAQGDHLIGTWTDTHFTGVILWKSSSTMSYSLGKFELNEKGELEQSQYGDIRTKDGDFYQGEISNSRFNGYGTLRKPDGSYYKGFFLEGKYHDIGEELNVLKKTLYRGIFNSNLMHGIGILQYLDNSLTKIYRTVCGYFEEGICRVQFSDSAEHTEKIADQKMASITMDVGIDERTGMYEQTGICIATLCKKSTDAPNTSYRFEGEIRQGRITGMGTITKKEPEDKNEMNIYEGSFEDGYLQGYGRLSIKTKEYYKGQFYHNNCKGIGIIKRANDLYEGYFDNMQMHHGVDNEVCVVSLGRDRCRIGMYERDKPINVHLVKETAIGNSVSTKVVLYKYVSIGTDENRSERGAERVAELPNRGWFDF